MIPTVLMLDLHGEEGTHRHLRFALQGGDIRNCMEDTHTHLRRRYLRRRVNGKAEAQLPNVSAGNTSM